MVSMQEKYGKLWLINPYKEKRRLEKIVQQEFLQILTEMNKKKEENESTKSERKKK